MLKKHSEMKTLIREQVKGGRGAVRQLQLLTPDDMAGYARHCVVMTIEPGCSIGAHDHPEEAEFFYMLEGELITAADGREVLFEQGDCTFTTGAGNLHMLENRSERPARVLAVVMTPKSL